MPRMARFPGSWLVLLAAVACTGSTEIVTPPPPPASGFTLRFVPEPEDGATAAALGWGSGLPGLTATLTPTDSSRPARVFTSDPAGTVAIPDLVAGDYMLEATRWLTAAERAELASGDDGDGFATRTVLRASTGTGSETVAVPASRPHGLVLSEWAFNHFGLPGIGAYTYDGFLELYNNADTTIYLDGMIIAEGFRNGIADTPAFPCAESRPFRDDSAGVWSWAMERFPGTGHSFPIHPGEVRTVATDAIDHRALFPDALDLSHADFEFRGSGDVDNPAVPDLTDLSLAPYPDGHGLEFQGLAIIAVVALPLDPANLVRGNAGGGEYVRIPKARIVDILTLRSNFATGFTECSPLVAAGIDREWSDVRGTDYRDEHRHSVSRRVAGQGLSGRPLLWYTRSSFADFERTLRSPGAIR
jgi:hypothetical protein